MMTYESGLIKDNLDKYIHPIKCVNNDQTKYEDFLVSNVEAIIYNACQLIAITDFSYEKRDNEKIVDTCLRTMKDYLEFYCHEYDAMYNAEELIATLVPELNCKFYESKEYDNIQTVCKMICYIRNEAISNAERRLDVTFQYYVSLWYGLVERYFGFYNDADEKFININILFDGDCDHQALVNARLEKEYKSGKEYKFSQIIEIYVKKIQLGDK